jgi:hypothetical protein
VEPGETVMLEPVPTSVPPHEPVYHLEDEFPPVAVKVVLFPLQMLVVPVIPVGADEDGAVISNALIYIFCSLGLSELINAAGLVPQLNPGGCPVLLEYVITILATEVKETSAVLFTFEVPHDSVPVNVFPDKTAPAQFLVIVGVTAVVRSD